MRVTVMKGGRKLAAGRFVDGFRMRRFCCCTAKTSILGGSPQGNRKSAHIESCGRAGGRGERQRASPPQTFPRKSLWGERKVEGEIRET